MHSIILLLLHSFSSYLHNSTILYPLELIPASSPHNLISLPIRCSSEVSHFLPLTASYPHLSHPLSLIIPIPFPLFPSPVPFLPLIELLPLPIPSPSRHTFHPFPSPVPLSSPHKPLFLTHSLSFPRAFPLISRGRTSP